MERLQVALGLVREGAPLPRWMTSRGARPSPAWGRS